MQPDKLQERFQLTSIIQWMLPVFIFAAAIGFGLNYDTHNQITYHIQGLTKIDPTFLKGDWHAHETQHYHDNYSSLFVIFDKFNLHLPTAFITLHVLLRVLGIYMIYKCISLICKERGLLTFILALSLIMIETTATVALTYIFCLVIQPSVFGSVFSLVGFYYFLKDRPLLSGTAIAFGGLMHTNFLILNIMVWGLVHICTVSYTHLTLPTTPYV